MKPLIFIVLLLLSGCGLFQGGTGHYRTISGYNYYYVDSNKYELKVRDELIRAFYRPGIHGNWGTEKLAVREIIVTLEFDDDIDNITASSDIGRSHKFEELKNHTYGSPVSVFWSGFGGGAQCQKEARGVIKTVLHSSETTHYKLHACPDTLVVTEKATNKQCIIDLIAFNNEYTHDSYSREYPISRMFNYALQDSDGSVVIRANNHGYVREKKITLYQVYCGDKVVTKNIDIAGMGEGFFILYVSSYGTPTAILHYDKHKNNRIVTLDGEIQYDGPRLKYFGWNGLLLPDHKAYYEFETKVKEEKGKDKDKDQFELVITRYNYGKGSVEEKRILIQPPTQQ